jgi:hypothetical protein
LAVTQKDFRLNFCINNGSKSMPSMVPIYSPDYLDELLDEVRLLFVWAGRDCFRILAIAGMCPFSALSRSTRELLQLPCSSGTDSVLCDSL